MIKWNFMPSWVENETRFITLGPGFHLRFWTQSLVHAMMAVNIQKQKPTVTFLKFGQNAPQKKKKKKKKKMRNTLELKITQALIHQFVWSWPTPVLNRINLSAHLAANNLTDIPVFFILYTRRVKLWVSIIIVNVNNLSTCGRSLAWYEKGQDENSLSGSLQTTGTGRGYWKTTLIW